MRHSGTPGWGERRNVPFFWATSGREGEFLIAPPSPEADRLPPFNEMLGVPARCPFTLFGGRVPLLKSTTEKSWYPDSKPLY